MAKDLKEMTIAELTELYNSKADKPIKKFASKAKGIERCQALGLGNGKKKKQSEGPGRVPNFNFEQADEVYPAREGTLRGDCVELLKGGATIADVQKLVEKYDKAKGKKSDTIERRAYELVRIMHFQLGHGIKHNAETGMIKITGRAAA